jgi:hypothetical protein
MATVLTRTHGTPTNSKKWTISFWMKRAMVNNWDAIFGCDYDTGDSYYGVGSGGQARHEIGLLEYHTSATNYGQGYTDASLRDPSAWYHIVFAYDSTQSTAVDRGKTYINGVFASSTYSDNIPQNHDSKFNSSGVGVRIGNRSAGGGSADFEGLLSHFHFIDGTAYDATPFGSTDSTTGEWKINTSPSVTYGNNGFFVLKDGNSVTDQSGNGNNLTVTSGTLTNTEDCPSNVFATGNPLIKGTNGNTNGNLTNTSGQNSWENMWSTLGASSGKWYAEFKPISHSLSYSSAVGVTKSEEIKTFDEIIGKVGGVHWQSHGSIYDNNVETSSGGSVYSSYGTSDIVGVAMDLDNGKLYFSKNGTWENSGDPTSGATGTGAISISTNTFYHFGFGNYNGVISANFGNGYFGTTAVSSAGTNASGNGIFEYDVPSGYTALSTKGLNL